MTLADNQDRQIGRAVIGAGMAEVFAADRCRISRSFR